MPEAGPHNVVQLLLGAVWGYAPWEPSHHARRKHAPHGKERRPLALRLCDRPLGSRFLQPYPEPPQPPSQGADMRLPPPHPPPPGTAPAGDACAK